MHHSTDLVLITPPALLLIAAIFAAIAYFRRPRAAEADADDDETEIEIIAPPRAARAAPPSATMETEDEVGIPAFAAEQRSEPSMRGAFDDDRGRPQDSDWNPRKKQPPPPRAKPAFKPLEDEYEDEEPSGFSRFALGLSGILSFALYAALAGAAVLIVWSVRNDPGQPAATVAEAPAVSSSVELAPPPAELARPPSAEQTLQPILTGEPIREVSTSGAAPTTTPSELVAETATSQEPGTFGAVTMPNGPAGIPTLADDFTNEGDSTPLPPVSAAPPSLPPEEPSAEPLPAESVPLALESSQPEPSVAAPGQPLPRAIPPQMAALRTAPGTGPTVVARQPANANNTGL